MGQGQEGGGERAKVRFRFIWWEGRGLGIGEVGLEGRIRGGWRGGPLVASSWWWWPCIERCGWGPGIAVVAHAGDAGELGHGVGEDRGGVRGRRCARCCSRLGRGESVDAVIENVVIIEGAIEVVGSGSGGVVGGVEVGGGGDGGDGGDGGG